MNPAILVFFYGSITALATGLGALPFGCVPAISARTIAYANSIAAGLMLGASFGMVAEGSHYGTTQTVIGVNAGVLFILLVQRFLKKRNIPFGSLSGKGARQMLLMLVVMTAHSFAEGIAVGAAFGGQMALGGLITAAVAVHNIPEGMAISAVFRPKGTSLLGCAGWSIVSSLPQPLMAVPAFLFVDSFAPALPYGMGFAAGAMVFMVLEDLLPRLTTKARRPPSDCW